MPRHSLTASEGLCSKAAPPGNRSAPACCRLDSDAEPFLDFLWRCRNQGSSAHQVLQLLLDGLRQAAQVRLRSAEEPSLLGHACSPAKPRALQLGAHRSHPCVSRSAWSATNSLCFGVSLWDRTGLVTDLAAVVQTVADLHERLHYAAVNIRPELMFADVDEDGQLRLNLTDLFSGLFVDQPGEVSVLAAGMLSCRPYRQAGLDLHSRAALAR